MTEVILNDECVHCADKECHDGEHFCRQAMKDNSFYKNAKLYKGLEVIQSPTYKELEQENAKLRKELKEWKDEWQEQVQKATDEGYARTLQTIQLTKAKDHIKKLLDCLKQDTNDPQTNYYVCQYMDKAEQFIKEIEK